MLYSIMDWGWELVVGSTTGNRNHTGWLDLGFGCLQLWIWLCVILPYVMFEWKQVKTGFWWCRNWLFWVVFQFFQLWMLNYCGIIEESVIALTLNALNGLIYGLWACKYGFVCMWFCNMWYLNENCVLIMNWRQRKCQFQVFFVYLN